jgi:hypothetical protein
MRRRKVNRSEQLGESPSGVRPHLCKKEGRSLTPLIWFAFLHMEIIA